MSKTKSKLSARTAENNTNEKYAAYRGSDEQQKDKPENFLKTGVKLLSLLKGDAFPVLLTVIFGCIGAYLSILGPRYLGDIINVLDTQIKVKLSSGAMDFSPIYGICKTVLIIYFFSSLLGFLQHYIMAGVVQKLITGLRSRLNHKLSVLPLSYFDSHNKGDLLSRITNDIDNINNTLQNNLIQIITSVVTFVGVFAIMLKYSVSLSLTSLMPFPICMAVAMIILRFSKAYFRSQWKITGDINGHIEEMFTGHKIVKAFGHEQPAIEEFDEINESLYHAGRKAQFLSGILSPLINFANNAGYVVICVIGGYLIIKGKQSVGAITVFMAYTKMFMQPIVDLSNIANNLQSSLASAERVFAVIEAPEEKIDTAVTEISSGSSVEFRNVDFSYSDDKPLLENLNLTVGKGELVAIVGPTGAGKTTIVNLLMRFYEVKSGQILIDGVDIQDITRSNLRHILGMVLQDTWLFEGTIRENILYSRPEATEEEFLRAVEAAKVDHFVSTLSDGYDTLLEEDGINLSAGQRQLITIARAILASPDILILDEATSSVDTRTEMQIQQAMQNLMQGRTNFVIAHRLSTIRSADQILVMDEGRIVETGTHEDLMNNQGFYAEIYNSQFAL
ncbi:MAG: ABC transporter ATP-binding protein [Oscillospiraceae bacterium]|nr:ABC transporter ATP-binding protein [Oscillospiraceae bacterium]